MMLINTLGIEELVKYYDLGEFRGSETDVIKAIGRCLEEGGYLDEDMRTAEEEVDGLRDELTGLEAKIGIPNGWELTTNGQSLTICNSNKSFTFADPNTTHSEGEKLALELIQAFLEKQELYVQRRS
jgi:hypothetical protein